MALRVSNRFVAIPRKDAVLRTTAGVNVGVPALYRVSLGKAYVGGGPTSYHVYIIRIVNHHGLTPTYTAHYARNVMIGADALHIVGTHGIMTRLVLSSRPGSYLAYPGYNGYRLRALTLHFGVHRVPFGNNRLSPHGQRVATSVIHGVSGYVFYHHYRDIYGSMRAINTLDTVHHKFGAAVTPTFSEVVARDRYACYKRYITIYPMNTLARHSCAGHLLSSLTGPSGIIVMRATPTIHTTLKRRFNFPPNAIIAKGVICTLHRLKFSCIFSASFTTSLAVVRRNSRVLGQLAYCLGKSGSIQLPVLASYYPT